MEIICGKSVFSGIAIGKIKVYKKEKQQVEYVEIADTDAEIARYENAKREAIWQIKDLYDKTFNEIGKEEAAIFEVHQMMLEDKSYTELVKSIVQNQRVNIEFAIASTRDKFVNMFSQMDDDYMKERAADVMDISERLLTILGGRNNRKIASEEPVIIVAQDLLPSETMQLDRDKVLSFVTVRGSLNSHAAILARTMGIPSLVGTPIMLSEELDGKLGIVDGINGKIYIDPDEKTQTKMYKKRQQEEEKRNHLLTFKGKETRTLDGQKIMLYANIGSVEDLPAVIHNNAEGIGLFRSEFLYLEKESYPTEEEQFQVYRQVAEAMKNKRVVIRTLDIGTDKTCDYFGLEPEENPALGYRAIRICLTRPEVFKTQLRAIFRASIFGKIAIMYPMITSTKEIRKIQEIVAEVKTELAKEGIKYGEPEQGIMIETPAAAIISDELAKEVDFFSIGTNDLTQYTLAIDRQNTKLDEFYDAHHPSILRMISMVVENAHKSGIWVGICGELGADQTLTRFFLSLDVDELSVSPGNILPIRKIVRETNMGEGNEERLINVNKTKATVKCANIEKYKKS